MRATWQIAFLSDSDSDNDRAHIQLDCILQDVLSQSIGPSWQAIFSNDGDGAMAYKTEISVPFLVNLIMCELDVPACMSRGDVYCVDPLNRFPK